MYFLFSPFFSFFKLCFYTFHVPEEIWGLRGILLPAATCCRPFANCQTVLLFAFSDSPSTITVARQASASSTYFHHILLCLHSPTSFDPINHWLSLSMVLKEFSPHEIPHDQGFPIKLETNSCPGLEFATIHRHKDRNPFVVGSGSGPWFWTNNWLTLCRLVPSRVRWQY